MSKAKTVGLEFIKLTEFEKNQRNKRIQSVFESTGCNISYLGFFFDLYGWLSTHHSIIFFYFKRDIHSEHIILHSWVQSIQRKFTKIQTIHRVSNLSHVIFFDSMSVFGKGKYGIPKFGGENLKAKNSEDPKFGHQQFGFLVFEIKTLNFNVPPFFLGVIL